jgi:multiple sugar transport system permease protein
LKVLTVSLASYRGTFDIEIGQMAAAAVLATVPVLVVVLVFQRQIVEGLVEGAAR